MLKDLPREALLRPLTRNEVVGMLVRLTIFGAATYYSIKWVVEAMDPTSKQKNQAKKRAEQLMKRIGVEGVKLTEYEMNIATHLVDPQTMKVSWRDIAGLDEIINELQDTVILPFQKRHLLAGSKLFQPPKESFLRNRSSLDHEATAMMKAQFMSLWDGLETSSATQVMIMGATNRPQDVDAAILRRMPTTFHVGLPNARQRQDILRLILAGENLSNTINLKEIAEKTEGYSGSDLRELCRDAAMYRVRDYVRKEQMRQIAQQLGEVQEEEKLVADEQLRPVTQLDLLFGLDKMRESKRATVSMLPSVSEVPLD
ncbi:outer mitochondrial transmembrane helix translocase isoform X3 [Dunckerocampus dactyliophorus]|uniref:outer mitochondrial transmembrane helix translocase isoform X3 n=1 Tax=Dunckerocampus dactyliophorus TaxID=161453 RepID=UPI0024053659|nr:outer mitochondrial transmembrane helix translocase isoform X3 [Dunckerocampus dactyliophorus]